MQTPSRFPANHTQAPPSPAFTSLLDACRTGNEQRVAALLARGGVGEGELQRCLLVATQEGAVGAVRVLLRAGAGTGISPLEAVKRGDREVLGVFLEGGWGVNDVVGWKDQVVLPHAVHDLPTLQYLLDHGADPNLGGTHKPLNAAARLPPTAAIPALDLLLSAGANLSLARPLHAVVSEHSILDTAAIPTMSYLLEKGCDINALDVPEGEFRAGTPLHCAVLEGMPARARWLVERGARTDGFNLWGAKAIDMANSRRREEFRRILEGED